ncbi:MAG: 50S ribosomal protein L23, partial [Gammaproteobacteria bacterium]|nr:50S ribosomal protein L23 [Gammaproteobacteria bacterium]
EVEVKSVKTLNVKGKIKRQGQQLGKRVNWKKAYVSLKDGQEIDFLGNEA